MAAQADKRTSRQGYLGDSSVWSDPDPEGRVGWSGIHPPSDLRNLVSVKPAVRVAAPARQHDLPRRGWAPVRG